MLLEITQQIIEILNKATTAIDGADLENNDAWEHGRKRQAVVDTCNKLIDINQANLDILYPDRKKVPVQYVK